MLNIIVTLKIFIYLFIYLFILATDDQKFKDSNGIYYQFVPDAVGDQPLHTDFMPIVTFTCQTIMV